MLDNANQRHACTWEDTHTHTCHCGWRSTRGRHRHGAHWRDGTASCWTAARCPVLHRRQAASLGFGRGPAAATTTTAPPCLHSPRICKRGANAQASVQVVIAATATPASGGIAGNGLHSDKKGKDE